MLTYETAPPAALEMSSLEKSPLEMSLFGTGEASKSSVITALPNLLAISFTWDRGVTHRGLTHWGLTHWGVLREGG